MRKIVRERDATLDEWRELRALLGHARSIDYAQRTASSSWSARSGRFARFRRAPARDALLFLPDYVLSRDR